MRIHKAYIAIFCVIVIASLVLAGVSMSNRRANLLLGDISTLKEYTNQTEINPTIGPCIKINEFECRARIYQENLVNKDLTITTNSDSELGTTENQIVCIGWNNLTKSEIEDKLAEESIELLEGMAKVKRQRESSKNQLTDEINLVIEERT